MHYAVHEHTAAELIYERVDSDKPFVGMTNFKGNYITEDDVKIAKNYLSEKELQRLNLMVSQFLDFAELQALDEIRARQETAANIQPIKIFNAAIRKGLTEPPQ